MEQQYRCSQCGAEYAIRPDRMVCSHCAGGQRPDEPLRGILEVVPDPGGRDLPVPDSYFPPIPVGNTPLWEPAGLRESTGFPGLYLKDDTANPTGSLKDRASYLVAAFARQHGYKEIVLASTGNAGSSMAGVGAAAGLKVTLFLPWDAPAAKRVQAQACGADVRRVKGSYDQAGKEAKAYLESHPGAMSRSTAYNPMTLEGKKTAALEIFRQLGERRTLWKRMERPETSETSESSETPEGGFPDHIFVPTGDGCILGGVIKGFQDLLETGRISRMPRLWAVQAEGSRAIDRALRRNGEFGPPAQADTLADSISVDVPAAGYYAAEKLKAWGGRTVTVSDRQILLSQVRLARESGLFAEPAAAAALAGFLQAAAGGESGQAAEGAPRPEETTVLLITGSGLKDPDTALKALELD